MSGNASAYEKGATGFQYVVEWTMEARKYIVEIDSEVSLTGREQWEVAHLAAAAPVYFNDRTCKHWFFTFKDWTLDGKVVWIDSVEISLGTEYAYKIKVHEA